MTGANTADAWPPGMTFCTRRRFLPWRDAYTGPLWQYDRETEPDPSKFPPRGASP